MQAAPPVTLRGLLIKARDAVADGTGIVLASCLPLARCLLVAAAPVAYRFRRTRHFQRRVVDALAVRLKKRGGAERSYRVGSMRIAMDVSDFCVRHHYFSGECYEPDTTELFMAVVRPSDIVLDVGANHGYFTVLAAHLAHSQGRIAAFEANPAAATVLRRHVQANQVADRVEIIEAAVNEAGNGRVQFFVGRGDDDVYSSMCPSEFAIRQGWVSTDQMVSVPTCSLDNWMGAHEWPHVRLLKIDVEGAEESVLKGMAMTLAQSPPDFIVCETTWGEAAHRSLVACGYAPERLCGSQDYGNILYVRQGIAR
ncbi:MAG: FkbM family methyltransferase [Planctomycetaceae bacterium]|nr:FkbM family methyltransferase [Planctomycetaceae bacterium]